jgi:phosphate transport system protein
VAEFLRYSHSATQAGDSATGRVLSGGASAPAPGADDGAGVSGDGAEIALIDKRVIQLFALVGEAIAGSTAVLLTGDRVAARALVQRDADIDARYRELDRAVLGLLAEGRSGEEMAHLVAVLRILPELERSGDLAEHVARRATRGISTEMTARARGLVERMGDVACAMWRMAADSYGDRRRDVADELDALDDELDELHVSLTAELVGGTMTIPVVIELVLIARFYERLGDHAVNIARRVPIRGQLRASAPAWPALPEDVLGPAPTTTRLA